MNNNIYKDINYLFKNTPRPHAFIDKPLESNVDIVSIVTELGSMLPQLSSFINQFNDTVYQSDISVITDSCGNMAIDVPENMSESEANNISKRIFVIDRLITTRGQEVNELLQKGLGIEKELRAKDPNYKSVLGEKILEFKRLNQSYKH
jgi:hypothetical protein